MRRAIVSNSRSATPDQRKVDKHPGTLQSKCLNLEIYIHEIGLHSPRSHLQLQQAGAAPCCSWCASAARHDIVVSCVRGAQACIEMFLQLPDALLRRSTLIEEARLLYAILILSIVTLEQGTWGPDARRLAELANIGHYLAALDRRFAALVTLLPSGRERRDYFWRMRRFAASSVDWHCRYMAGGAARAPADPADRCSVELSFMNILSKAAFHVREDDEVADEPVVGPELLDTSWMMDQANIWPDLGMHT